VKILLSNDDGYRAEGLTALAAAIRPLGDVTIVAPDRNRSGASNSLTLDVPVRAARFARMRTTSTARRPIVCIWQFPLVRF
jgi:5'-nucleotidase